MSYTPCYAGLDVGSATTKAALLDGEGTMIAHVVLPSGGDMAAAAAAALDQALDQCELPADTVQALIATGYGREKVEGRTKAVTEITCHAQGAFALNDAVRAVIDIGGQDSKAIALDARGMVQKFEMNDKCAAGTGRFLEVMARLLDVELSTVGPMALDADRPAKISSTCTVFAESEVVSLLAQGESTPRILAGLCQSISQRVSGLAARVGMRPTIMMTGGVARNAGVAHFLQAALGQKIEIPDFPQITGAYGAALIARKTRP